jgi:hypothetical protein
MHVRTANAGAVREHHQKQERSALKQNNNEMSYIPTNFSVAPNHYNRSSIAPKPRLDSYDQLPSPSPLLHSLLQHVTLGLVVSYLIPFLVSTLSLSSRTPVRLTFLLSTLSIVYSVCYTCLHC